MALDPPLENPASPHRASLPARGAGIARWRGWWVTLALLVAALPVSGALSPNRVFHVRDLSLFFWGRYLWLRRSLLSGEWPLWDPYAGAGQSAVADALHQMFLLPVVALRLLGSEVAGFNLWVAVPLPFAALGAYLFLRARFSRSASALGAIAFAASGPVVSSVNTPNLAWSVAIMPWMFWAVDRLLAARRPAQVALLAVACAFQALAGEPVTFSATAGAAIAYAAWVGSPDAAGEGTIGARLKGLAPVASGLALGLGGAAIQLLPLAAAVRDSWRPYGVSGNFWSFHPLALAEMFSPHLFGDYLTNTGYSTLPWMPPLNSGRDPFFYSVYFGAALIAIALFGAVLGWRRRWSGYWIAIGGVALLAAFGSHTPFYPFLQAHVPVVGSFRFPVKFLLLVALALAALVAAGWDGLSGADRRAAAPWRFRAARICGVAFPVLVGAATYLLSGACLYFPDAAARAFFRLAAYVGVRDPVAGAAFMLRTLPQVSTHVMLRAVGAVLFLAVASSRRRETRLAQAALYGLVVVELSVAAWGINPTLDAKYLDQPSWIDATRADPQSRFYFGGKFDGTLVEHDLDGPRSFIRPAGMSPVDGRSALSGQLAYAPGAWRAREMLSYDLAVLWPRTFDLAAARFRRYGRIGRDRFLWTTGVRYRVVPLAVGGSRPSVPVEYFNEVRLFDWGPVYPRVSIVPEAVVLPDVRRQIDRLFDPSFDPAQAVALTAPAADAAGQPGPAADPAARVVNETANTVTVETGVPAGGGYLLLLDSFAPGWTATVDGAPANVLQANALFRAVRLSQGRHTVAFRYLPMPFLVGAGVSGLSLVAVLGLWVVGRRRADAAIE